MAAQQDVHAENNYLVCSYTNGQQYSGSGCTNSIQHTHITEKDNELDEIEKYGTVFVLILHIYGIVSQLREIIDMVFEYFPTKNLT